MTLLYPGDFNGDGTVNAADYIVWRKSGGTQDEYNAWRANFGKTLSSSGSVVNSAEGVVSVPEPAGGFLSLSRPAVSDTNHKELFQNRLREGTVPFCSEHCAKSGQSPTGFEPRQEKEFAVSASSR